MCRRRACQNWPHCTGTSKVYQNSNRFPNVFKTKLSPLSAHWMRPKPHRLVPVLICPTGDVVCDLA